MTWMRPIDAVAQIISLRAMGSDARRVHRPGSPAGAGLAVTRSASSSGARAAIGPPLRRAKGSAAGVTSGNDATGPSGGKFCARARRTVSIAPTVVPRNLLRFTVNRQRSTQPVARNSLDQCRLPLYRAVDDGQRRPV